MRTFAKVFLIASLAIPTTASTIVAADHIVLLSGDYFGAMFFDPSSITINQGDRILWQNVTTLVHTSTSGSDCAPNGTWNTGSVNPGATSAPVTFNTVGSFDYYCRFHCEMGMVGEVNVVQAPVRTERTTWGRIKALYASAKRP